MTVTCPAAIEDGPLPGNLATTLSIVLTGLLLVAAVVAVRNARARPAGYSSAQLKPSVPTSSAERH